MAESWDEGAAARAATARHSIHHGRAALGGLSGCTFEEAVSWGKVKREASRVQVFSEASIIVPLVVQVLRAPGKMRKSVPRLRLEGNGLELRYEKG